MKPKTFGFARTTKAATQYLFKLVLLLTASFSLVRMVGNTAYAQAYSIAFSTPCVNGLQVDINGGVYSGPTNFLWNWGDGQQAPGSFPQSHSYTSAGQYIIRATAYYSNGIVASNSQPVTVGPGILSGCYSCTINAGQGGAVSYQASVASGIVPPGGSVTLQQAYADDPFLTANPSASYSFSNWSASSEIWFNYGSSNTPSVGAVVDGNSTITANFIPLPSSQLNQGLVAWYPFNGNANDASGNGNNLTVYGATLTANRLGVADSAYSFDGISDYLQIGQFNNLPLGSSARSVNMFFQLSTGGGIIYWGQEQEGNGSSFAVLVVSYQVWSDNFFDGGILPIALDQNWHMLTVTCDQNSTTEDFYLDGTFVGSFAIPQPLNTQPGILRIGARIQSSGDLQAPYGGVLGEIRVYNRVLNSGEIQQLYQAAGLPTVSTSAASAVTANSATLNGSVNPNGLSTTAYFQWGKTTNYGYNTISQTIGVGTAAQNVYAPISGNVINASTTYHFRLVASSSAGTVPGADQSFTTSNGPPSIVSPTLSMLMVAANTAPADGITAVMATVTLRDANTNPVSGKTVAFYASEVNSSGAGVGNSLTIYQMTFQTDVNGQAFATIKANTPGTVTITVKDTTDNIGVSQPLTVTFTATGATPVPTPLILKNAIKAFYQETANMLDGSVGYSTTTTPSFSISPIPWIAPDEGQAGDYFQSQIDADGAKSVVDGVFFFAGESIPTEDLTLLEQLVIAEGLTIENTFADLEPPQVQATIHALFDTIAGDSSGLTEEATTIVNASSAYQQLLDQEQYLLDYIPQRSANQVTAYTNDIQLRLFADYVLVNVLAQQESQLDILQSSSQASQTDWFGPLLGQTAVVGGAVVASQFVPGVDVGVDVALLGYSEYQNYQAYTGDSQAYAFAQHSLLNCSTYSGQVYSNASGAFSDLLQGITPSPVTGYIFPSALVALSYVANIPDSFTTSGIIQDPNSPGPLTAYDIVTNEYSIVTIQNTSSSMTAFEVFALYNYSSSVYGVTLPEVVIAQTNVNVGQTASVRLQYFNGNSGESPYAVSAIRVYVLGLNDKGIYYVGTPAGVLSSINPSTPIPNNNIASMENPIRCSIVEDLSKQTYKAKIWVESPFIIPLSVVVTQPMPSGAAVLTTDGTLQGSSIVWTNSIAASNAVEHSFTFSFSAIPGALSNLPAAFVVFSDTNGNSLSLEGVAPNFKGLFPVQVKGSIPLAIFGIDSPMQVTVTNLASAGQTGSLAISVTDSTGNIVTNFSEAFSVGTSGSTNLGFTLPGSLAPGSYSLAGSLIINGGTGQVLGGTYVVPAPPIMLAPASTSPLTTNGFGLAVQGPAGNYLIEASPDISSPTNWLPILFYSSTNSPFYYYFTDPSATNSNQRFYRAVTQ